MELMNKRDQNNTLYASSFSELIATPFLNHANAIGWKRSLNGDFKEIMNLLDSEEKLIAISEKDLLQLKLTKQGELARETLLHDLAALQLAGAQPSLNIISAYEKDTDFLVFPTDVYSFHVDKSPVATSTFLCTYFGPASEILANEDAEQKICIPEIREQLQQIYSGPSEGFEAFLSEYFFDLHYQAKPNALPQSLGTGNLWKLAVDHPKSNCLPCIHRAPIEHRGEKRLLLIC